MKNPAVRPSVADVARPRLVSGYPVRLLLLPFVLLLLLGRVLVPLRAANMTLTKAMLDDYSPTSSSGAFNTGTNVPAYGIVDDFAGTGRPQGAAYDIGAYERLASGGDSTAELAIKGDGNNVFRFLMNQNATSTTTFPANGTDVNVQWYINCSGVTKSYTRPDGSAQTLNNLTAALWVNNTRLLTNIAKPASFQATGVSDFRLRLDTSLALTLTLDDLVITQLP